MLPDRFNPRVRLRDWLNKPSRADLARPPLQEVIISTVTQDIAVAGRINSVLRSRSAVAVDESCSRAVGTRILGGTDINFSLPEGVEARRHIAADGTTHIDLVESARPEGFAPDNVHLEQRDVSLGHDGDCASRREDDVDG
ncbi:hypothetical protein BI317_15935 [Xanthomonas hortorum pv. gardneri]|uniref:hypothetical protein n=1 Tax=Xanthomonas hortorum TaxID=56454 RepID=UPI0009381DB8|nr:hypothetical protein [Xanthomonas hortorum]APP85441.1 hypothetical protein BI317_15935 [Xanthomonas hortorum pv. gardneri]